MTEKKMEKGISEILGVKDEPRPPAREDVTASGERSIRLFDRMFGPTLISVIYILGVVALVGGALYGIVATARLERWGTTQEYIALLVVLILIGTVIANMIWRLACESWVLLFRIYDNLRLIRRESRSTNDPAKADLPPGPWPGTPVAGGTSL